MKKVIKKKMSIEDLALSMGEGFERVESLIEKKIDGLAISTAKGFVGVKKDINDVESSLSKKIEQVSTDLKSFKTETRERFDTLEKKVDGIDENVNAIITDYHPRIKVLEEKVLGFSTLE